MNSLRQTRLEKAITRKQIAESLGIGLANLSPIENGKQVPSVLTRRRLELMLGTKINWLDTPFLNTSPRYETNWDDTERNFRGLIRMIAGLIEEERNVFCTTAIKHLKALRRG